MSKLLKEMGKIKASDDEVPPRDKIPTYTNQLQENRHPAQERATIRKPVPTEKTPLKGPNKRIKNPPNRYSLILIVAAIVLTIFMAFLLVSK